MSDLPADPQQLAIDFLSHPANYGLRDEAVERIETHCSIVFLAGDRAYKLKRAIRYASLDYTTGALRKAACEAELHLNQRTAPEIYLGVSSINRSATGVLAFDASGPSIDHVVVMRRFARSDLFDHMADTRRLTPDLMLALGESIARFHAAAEPAPGFGGSDAISRVIADNDRELALVGAMLDGAAVGGLSDRAKTGLVEVAALLDRRRAEGSVRRCHGDLRLANICLYGGRPTLFDCIEFSDEIGCIDVLYDLAFLLMDLHMRGHFDLCNAVFNAYLDHAREMDGLRVLPLFLSLRAATRGYALAGGARRAGQAPQAEHLRALARRHIDAAISFLNSPSPVLILLGGDDGQRRVETAARLAALVSPAPGARILHLGSSGEATWREVLAVLTAGCSVLLEGVFTSSDEQNAIVALPSIVRLLPCWLGSFPSGLNRWIWRSLDSGVDLQTIVAASTGIQAGMGLTPVNATP
jgi:aminoglycoside phosphotransferase family enzyme